jgi:hypothetical protein
MTENINKAETENASSACQQTESTPDLTAKKTSKPSIATPVKTYSDVSGLLPDGIESFEALNPHNSGAVNITQVIEEIENMLKQHCSMTSEEMVAITLWVVATYLINSFRVFPKLVFISPEKRCGKSTATELTDCLVRDSIMTSNLSKAALFRISTKYQPTFLIDEADRFVKDGGAELIGIINSGHTKAGATILRCTGDDHTPTQFSTWMPMALASIGNLPDTIMDRSITIHLKRKTSSEELDKLPSDQKVLSLPIREKLARWSLDNKGAVKNSTAEPPNIGNDRAIDNWTSLYKIAETIGGDWPTKCDKAYRHLTTVDELETPTQLLSDIREILSNHKEEKISSKQLLDKLLEDPSMPWQTINNGRNLTPHKMASLLTPYGVKSKCHRHGEKTFRGYEKAQFEDPFQRYLSPPN